LNDGTNYNKLPEYPNVELRSHHEPNRLVRNTISTPRVSQHHTFMSNNGCVVYNCKPDNDNNVTIDLKQFRDKNLSSVLLLIGDTFSQFSKTINLDN